MAEILVNGEFDAAYNALANNIIISDFVALKSGTVTAIYINIANGESVRVGVYTSGGTLLVNPATQTAVSDGWMAISTSLSVTKDSHYWFGTISTAGDTGVRNGAASGGSYYTQDIADDWDQDWPAMGALNWSELGPYDNCMYGYGNAGAEGPVIPIFMNQYRQRR